MEEFINKWQTLIGNTLGPFLAVVLSAIGFWIKSIIENKKERKEFLRRVEIGITRSIDDTFKTRLKLQYFVSRLKSLIIEIKDITNDRHFSLESINYPTIRDIYKEIDTPNFKVKSYYLHNKLLWADAGIKETNEIVKNLKNDFAELQRKNEMLVILMKQNQASSAVPQRAVYVENLESFVNAIEKFIEKFISQGIEIMIQIKIYNEYLRKKYGWWFLWKHEGTKFKYFRNKIEQKSFAKKLDSLNCIDLLIQKEVADAIKDAENRATKLQQ